MQSDVTWFLTDIICCWSRSKLLDGDEIVLIACCWDRVSALTLISGECIGSLETWSGSVTCLSFRLESFDFATNASIGGCRESESTLSLISKSGDFVSDTRSISNYLGLMLLMGETVSLSFFTFEFSLLLLAWYHFLANSDTYSFS